MSGWRVPLTMTRHYSEYGEALVLVRPRHVEEHAVLADVIDVSTAEVTQCRVPNGAVAAALRALAGDGRVPYLTGRFTGSGNGVEFVIGSGSKSEQVLSVARKRGWEPLDEPSAVEPPKPAPKDVPRDIPNADLPTAPMPTPRPVESDALTAAARVRALRTRLGWSQTELARRAGLEQPTVSHVERAHPNASAKSRATLLAVLESAYFGQTFTGTLRPFPGIPEDTNLARRARMSEVLNDCRELGLEPTLSVGADFEDFWEDAIRASAALRACREQALPLTLPAPGERPDPDRRLGPVSYAEEGRHGSDVWLFPDALRDHGGRQMARVWVRETPGLAPDDQESAEREQERRIAAQGPNSPCPDDLYGALLWLWARGVRTAVVKSGVRKSGVSVVPLSPTIRELRETLMRDDVLCWATIPEAAPAAGFLVQEWIPMDYEYRFFVVDGELVTGAGCVEEFTPLDHDPRDGVFDPQMRKTRGNGIAADTDAPVRRCLGLVERYREFLAPIAATLPCGQRTVVIDVALSSGAPVIVEFNALPNSGLYSSDTDAVMRALVTAKDRGYRSAVIPRR